MRTHQEPPSTLVGVISDTHGQLSRAAIQALEGVDQIIHAGDLDSHEILSQLERVAPVRAVRGNMDRREGLRQLQPSENVLVDQASIYVIHNLLDLDLNPEAAGFQVVIYGHTHVPENVHRNGILFLNPGSASFPRRGSKPTVARLRVRGNTVQAELIPLNG